MSDFPFQEIFKFLNSYRQYPQQVQQGYRQATLLPFESKEDRAYALLHSCYYTQRGAKLNKAKVFFKDLAEKPTALSSFKAFASYLQAADFTYKAVYENLSSKVKRDGWGPKTSALFLKNIYQLRHSQNEQDNKLCFWHDTPPLENDDRLFLPVDAVITKIFESAELPGKNLFKEINDYLNLSKLFAGVDMELWDDLWFWGFLTQQSGKGNREFVCFNEGKYRSLLHAPKDKKSIEAIRFLGKDFLKKLNPDVACQEEEP